MTLLENLSPPVSLDNEGIYERQHAHSLAVGMDLVETLYLVDPQDPGNIDELAQATEALRYELRQKRRNECDDHTLATPDSEPLQKILDDGVNNLREEYQNAGLPEDEVTAIDWLIDSASDEELQHFAQHWVYRLEAAGASADVQQSLLWQKYEYGRNYAKSRIDKVAHESARKRVLDFINDRDTNTITFSDDLALQRPIFGKPYAQYQRNDCEVVFGTLHHSNEASSISKAEMVEKFIATIEKHGFHEFNHAVLGQLDPSWLDEALTEHFAQVLKGQRDLYDLEPRSDKEIYVGNRNTLKTIVELTASLSGGDISFRDFIYAYTSDQAEDKEVFLEKIKTVFGLDIVGRIDKYRTQIIKSKTTQHEETHSTRPDRARRQEIASKASKTVHQRIQTIFAIHQRDQKRPAEFAAGYSIKELWLHEDLDRLAA